MFVHAVVPYMDVFLESFFAMNVNFAMFKGMKKMNPMH